MTQRTRHKTWVPDTVKYRVRPTFDGEWKAEYQWWGIWFALSGRTLGSKSGAIHACEEHARKREQSIASGEEVFWT